MKIKIRSKNGKAFIRLPAKVLKRLGNTKRLEMRLTPDGIFLSPVVEVPTMAEILMSTYRNARSELVDWGSPVGREVF